ncbi:hypothetical protein [Streptomyces sp. NPDC058953]|uniref:hypothetical protein n=1 Tax=unclassified Streptomyces TaxID=2593676 RepID=UPI0036857817
MIGSRTGLRFAALAFAATAVVGLGGVAVASPTPQNGVLEDAEMGLYYNSNQGGCVHDYTADDKTFSNNRFKGSPSCSGYDNVVNDDTASYRNRSLLQWCVFTDADWQGAAGQIPSGHIGNASVNFKNKISSSSWGACW